MMRTVRALGAALMFMLLAAGPASAHPLGNFTINHFSRVMVGTDAIQIRYVIDMAEIPAFQERSTIDTSDDDETDAVELDAYLRRNVPELVANLTLAVDGATLPLQVTRRDLVFPPGQGGLHTLRLTLELVAALQMPRGSAVYADDNFADQLGWREMVVAGAPDVEIVRASVPATDISDELRAYPADRIERPLDDRSATFEFRPSGSGATASQALGGGAGGETRADDPLSSIIGAPLSPLQVMLAVLLSIGLGAVHGISPGHGKTLVAAYLIGSRGTLPQALWLGVTVAVTHTVGVFILGAVTLAATDVLVPQRIIEWLSLVAGVMVIGLGAVLLARLLWSRGSTTIAEHQHPHLHEGEHPHPHAPLPQLSSRSLAALGLLGGLVPSGSALVVLLLGVTLDRVAFGLLLIVAFGAGMALVLTAISASVVLVRQQSQRDGGRWLQHRLLRKLGGVLPAATAVGALAIGIVLTIRAVAAIA